MSWIRQSLHYILIVKHTDLAVDVTLKNRLEVEETNNDAFVTIYDAFVTNKQIIKKL